MTKKGITAEKNKSERERERERDDASVRWRAG
jgi:hypothetical protein